MENDDDGQFWYITFNSLLLVHLPPCLRPHLMTLKSFTTYYSKEAVHESNVTYALDRLLYHPAPEPPPFTLASDVLLLAF